MRGLAQGEQFELVLTAARAGAEWALTALYRAVQPGLLRYLRARTGQDAEDVASQVWLEVARGLAGFAGDEDGFRGWVFTIARRRLSDHRRRWSRRPAEPCDAESLAGLRDRADTEVEALDGLAGDEAARRITALLPADQAEVVLLRVVAGLSVDHVARLTGRKPGTVRVMQHRALQRLAAALGPDGL